MKIEGRTAIVSSLLLTTSIYISGFSIYISTLVLILVFLFFPKIILNIKKFIPFLMFFFLSSFILSSLYYSIKITLSIFAILMSGLIVTNLSTSEFSKALTYFKIPESWALSVSLALRMLRVLETDICRCFEAAKLDSKSKFETYFKVLKAFTAIAVLRSVSLAEALYCKGYSGKVLGELRKPSLKDVVFLLLSIFVLILSLLLFFENKIYFAICVTLKP